MKPHQKMYNDTIRDFTSVNFFFSKMMEIRTVPDDCFILEVNAPALRSHPFSIFQILDRDFQKIMPEKIRYFLPFSAKILEKQCNFMITKNFSNRI